MKHCKILVIGLSLMIRLEYTNCMTDVTKERTGRLKVYDVENSWK